MGENQAHLAYQQSVSLYSFGKYKQLQHCLDEAVNRRIFSRKDLVAALERLSSIMPAKEGEKPLPVNDELGRSVYGSHYYYLSKDFQRIRETGRVVINDLREHFKQAA